MPNMGYILTLTGIREKAGENVKPLKYSSRLFDIQLDTLETDLQ